MRLGHQNAVSPPGDDASRPELHFWVRVISICPASRIPFSSVFTVALCYLFFVFVPPPFFSSGPIYWGKNTLDKIAFLKRWVISWWLDAPYVCWWPSTYLLCNWPVSLSGTLTLARSFGLVCLVALVAYPWRSCFVQNELVTINSVPVS